MHAGSSLLLTAKVGNRGTAQGGCPLGSGLRELGQGAVPASQALWGTWWKSNMSSRAKVSLLPNRRDWPSPVLASPRLPGVSDLSPGMHLKALCWCRSHFQDIQPISPAQTGALHLLWSSAPAQAPTFPDDSRSSCRPRRTPGAAKCCWGSTGFGGPWPAPCWVQSLGGWARKYEGEESLQSRGLLVPRAVS